MTTQIVSNIGIFGGTFNPIHFGHLRMAQELAEHLQLDEVRFIPSANPPHKTTPIVSAQDRAHMVKLAIAGNALFTLDEIELLRTGASYTIETLIELRKTVGDQTRLNLLMGTDAFRHFNTWHRWEEIIEYCHIVLVARPQPSNQPHAPLNETLEGFLKAHYVEDANALQQAAQGVIHMQAITPLSISSTDIRSRVKHRKSINYLTAQTVVDYINSQQFYQN